MAAIHPKQHSIKMNIMQFQNTSTKNTEKSTCNTRYGKISKTLFYLVAYGYAFLYAYTGSAKIMDISRFIANLEQVEMLRNFASLLGWGIPIVEIALATCLVYPNYSVQKFGLRASLGLMGIFIVYISSALLWMDNRLCSCGGVIETMDWTAHLIFNLFWLTGGLFVLHLNKS